MVNAYRTVLDEHHGIAYGITCSVHKTPYDCIAARDRTLMTKSWIDRVERRVSRWVSRGLGGPWVVAVSGVATAWGCYGSCTNWRHERACRCRWRIWTTACAGEASRADAEFVAELARSLGLPFDLGQWRPTRARHFESDARRARYAWLTEIARCSPSVDRGGRAHPR